MSAARDHRGDEYRRPLRIARVDAVPVALPLKKPVVMAGERIERSFNLLVRIEAESGLTGWGEASSAPVMTGDLLTGMVAAVNERLAPRLLGEDAMRRAALVRGFERVLIGNTGAKCAVEMALADLVGQHLGVSVADMFGGPVREDLVPMYLLGNPRIEDDIAEAKREHAAGWRFFKLKVGIKPPLEEAAAAIEVRRCLGDEVLLCADANTGMTFANARLFAERARDANLLFLEQPLGGDDFEGMAALARACPIPLNGDESIGSVSDLLHLHRMGAIQGANIKTIKMGGMGPAVQAMSVCAALGLCINLAGKVAESSIAAAAIAQLGCVAPNLDWGLNVTQHYLAEDVCDNPLLIEGGALRRPPGPGLGVTVNTAKVERFRVR
jgi:muconate cycloisomerase